MSPRKAFSRLRSSRAYSRRRPIKTTNQILRLENLRSDQFLLWARPHVGASIFTSSNDRYSTKHSAELMVCTIPIEIDSFLTQRVRYASIYIDWDSPWAVQDEELSLIPLQAPPGSIT